MAAKLLLVLEIRVINVVGIAVLVELVIGRDTVVELELDCAELELDCVEIELACVEMEFGSAAT
jgi:hypothetical protein